MAAEWDYSRHRNWHMQDYIHTHIVTVLWQQIRLLVKRFITPRTELAGTCYGSLTPIFVIICVSAGVKPQTE